MQKIGSSKSKKNSKRGTLLKISFNNVVNNSRKIMTDVHNS